MDPKAGFDRLVASITFAGSLISMLATAAVLCCYVYYRHEQRSFRHALVFNLALAEFINTLNNTISGAIYIRNQELLAGPACTANGFIGQLSVQAADFSILLIALVTLLTITRTASFIMSANRTRKILICLSVWVVPITTATTATALGVMGPVSGNWCWIMATYPVLRYSLTHGWRIGIMFLTAAIYIFVWWYMKRHFRSLVGSTERSFSMAAEEVASKRSWSSKRAGFRKIKEGKERGAANGQEPATELTNVSKSRISRVGGEWELSAPEAAHMGQDRTAEAAGVEQAANPPERRQRKGSADSWESAASRDTTAPRYSVFPTRSRTASGPAGGAAASDRRSRPTMCSVDGSVEEFPHRTQTRRMEREIKRMLWLNAYPIAYVALWVPGLLNRFMEASGQRRTPEAGRALAALQASSQFIGLANALTYGFNVALRRRLRRWWRERKARDKGDGFDF